MPIGLVFSNSLGSFVGRFMLPLRHRSFVFFLFCLLLRWTERAPVDCDEAFVRRSIQHRDYIGVVSVLVAVALRVLKLRYSGPIALIRFGRFAKDARRILLGRCEMR